MQDLRCTSCNKKLGTHSHDAIGKVEIKCARCKKLNQFALTLQEKFDNILTLNRVS
jgi:phage FluMu protein Com